MRLITKVAYWASIERATQTLRKADEPMVDALARYLGTAEGYQQWLAYLSAPAPCPEDLGPHAPGRMVRLPNEVWAYVPNPLPPAQLSLGSYTLDLLGKAEAAITELADTGRLLAKANPYLLWPLRRRSAVFAAGAPRLNRSALFIEPSPSCLSEVEGASRVEAYAKALQRGLGRLWCERVGVPLILQLHASVVPEDVSGGAYRQVQGYVAEPGGSLERARYVGPPPLEVPAAMAALDQFIRNDDSTPLLVKLALIHYQLGAIHPFVDGNGRTVRMLSMLLLQERGFLDEPILSLYARLQAVRRFHSNLLLKVSLEGPWSEWIDFFLTAVIAEAQTDVRLARQLLSLWRDYRAQIAESEDTGAAEAAVVDFAFAHPMLCLADVQAALVTSGDGAQASINNLTRRGILVTGGNEPAIFGRLSGGPGTGNDADSYWVAAEIVTVLQQPA